MSIEHPAGRYKRCDEKKAVQLKTERPVSPQKPRAQVCVPKATLREVMSFNATPAAAVQSKPNINLNIRLARNSL
jgi:hypothetical protein